MASIQLEQCGHYHISFRFNRKRYKRSLNTQHKAKALSRKTAIEEFIHLVQRGVVEIPQGVDAIAFILSEGKLKQSKHDNQSNNGNNAKPTPPLRVTLKSVFQQFFESIPDGNLEKTTLDGMHMHEQHLLRILKPDFPIQSLGLQNLQSYVNKRAKERTHFFANNKTETKRPARTKVTANTITKELVTLGTVWRWAEGHQKVTGSFPRRGLRLPKTKELPVFQTRDEIERKIARENLDGKEAADLWDALYLRRSEIDELLQCVKNNALHPFI